MTIQQRTFDECGGTGYNCPAMVSEAPEKFNPLLIARKAASTMAGNASGQSAGKAVDLSPDNSGVEQTGHGDAYNEVNNKASANHGGAVHDGAAGIKSAREDATQETGSGLPHSGVGSGTGIQLGANRIGFERFSVALPLSRFEKLQDVVLFNQGSSQGAMQGELKGELHAVYDLGFNDQHQVIAEGMMDVRVVLQCQRCLSEMTEDLSGPFSLVLVADEAAANKLPDDLEPVVMDEDGMLTPVALLEDELVLRVPVVPRHADASQCQFDVPVELERDDGVSPPAQQGSDQTGVGAAKKQTDGERKPGTQRPFEVLKNLKLN